jgi:hypothetical protein
MCTYDAKEHVFFTAKVFTLQELTITLWGYASEMAVYFKMQFNYTPDDADA